MIAPAPVSWDELLDRLEESLAGGAAFEPPAEVPPLPERLVPRARELAARQEQVIAELEAERDRVGAELAAQRRSAARGATSAATGASLSL